MSHRGDAYVMLMASLPDLGDLFRESQTPISRYRLNRRLEWLHPEDATALAAIEAVLQWSRLPLSRSEDAFVNAARTLLEKLDEPALVATVQFRLELRTIVAALRRRARGDGAPAAGWGFGAAAPILRRHWEHEAFGLARTHRWVPDAARLVACGDALSLERLQLSLAWQHHSRAQLGHYFDFVAVVLYVLKWNMVARWAVMSESAARRRFDRLIAAGLGSEPVASTDAPAALVKP
jgi:hypothetical protein